MGSGSFVEVVCTKDQLEIMRPESFEESMVCCALCYTSQVYFVLQWVQFQAFK